MSTRKETTGSTSTGVRSTLPTIPLMGVPRLIISDSLAAQIYKAHSYFPKGKEFCGILVYEVLEGGISDLDSMIIKAYGMLPVNIGSSGFTEGKFTEHLPDISYMFPNYLDGHLKVGMIHTHHSMDTFFSAEDDDELNRHAQFHLMYLSLIVNYRGSLSAKVAIPTKMDQSLIYKDLNGEDIRTSIESDAVAVAECSIEFDPDFQEFDDAVNGLLEEYKIAEDVAKKKSKSTYTAHVTVDKFLAKLVTMSPTYAGSLEEALRSLFPAYDADDIYASYFQDNLEKVFEGMLRRYPHIMEDDVLKYAKKYPKSLDALGLLSDVVSYVNDKMVLGS